VSRWITFKEPTVIELLNAKLMKAHVLALSAAWLHELTNATQAA
jgi:hypothetical protein